MPEGTASYVKITIVSLVLMVAVALGFRFFINRRPAAPSQQPPRMEKVPEPDAPEVCFVKPLDKWTDAEKAKYPYLLSWLMSKSKTVLPWEWSDEAIAKDPDGYCRLWAKTCWDEQVRLMQAAAGEAVREWTGRTSSKDEVTRLADQIAHLRIGYENRSKSADGAEKSSSALRALEPSSRMTLIAAILAVERTKTE